MNSEENQFKCRWFIKFNNHLYLLFEKINLLLQKVLRVQGSGFNYLYNYSYQTVISIIRKKQTNKQEKLMKQKKHARWHSSALAVMHRNLFYLVQRRALMDLFKTWPLKFKMPVRRRIHFFPLKCIMTLETTECRWLKKELASSLYFITSLLCTFIGSYNCGL